MEVVVHPEKEIVVTAVDNDRQIAVGDTRDQVDRRSCLPSFGMLGLRAQQLRNLPVFGERADIQPAARTADGPEQLLMPDRQRHGAETAHAEARDRASAAVARNGITFLDGRKQFPRHESLVKALRPHLAVEVPARRAVGTDEGDSFSVGNGGQRRFDPEPRRLIAAVTVEQIDRRAGIRRRSAVGQNHDHGNVAVHGSAAHRKRIDRSGGGKLRRQPRQQKG